MRYSLFLLVVVAAGQSLGAQKVKVVDVPKHADKVANALHGTIVGTPQKIGNATVVKIRFDNGRQSVVVVEGNYVNRVVHVRPGAAMSPESNILVGKNSIASTAVENDKLVIGHGRRENFWNVNSPEHQDLAKNHGLEETYQDFRSIVEKSQNALDNKPYDLIGPSAGAREVTDYLSRDPYDKFHQAVLLDPHPVYESTDAQEKARKTWEVYSNLAKSKPLLDVFNGVKGLAALAKDKRYRDGDSGYPRGEVGAGNFTNKNLFGYLLVNTNQVLDPETGMLRWYFNPGFFAGTYLPNRDDPKKDSYSLDLTNEATVHDMLNVIGGDQNSGGGISTKKMADLFAVAARVPKKDGGYEIDHDAIKGNVIIVRAGKGFGYDNGLANAMKKNAKVRTIDKHNFAHADVITDVIY